MRKAKMILTVLVAVVAVSAIASATASAAVEFLPGSGTFTSTSGSGTLAIDGGNTIECTKDTNSGSITGAKTISVSITFTGCTLFGFANAHSLGDPSNTILIAATGTLCTLSTSPLTVGLKLTPTGKIHIEAPLGQLAVVEGTVIGELVPLNKKSKTGELKLEQSGGLQKFKTCEGSAELKGSENEGTAKSAGEATTDTITFTNETELMG